MTSDSGFPVSLLLEGPLFMDELETQPQHFRRDHEIDALRLVPAKSAASGVHTIYFKPEHRQWALVRLVTRYRWLFEILLERGLSGEHMLLRQGFSPDDIEFLYDIVPQPPAEYNPIVYDILWLVATYDEYLTLTEAMADRETFVPEMLLRETPDVSMEDDGFFSRFLRSHLISRMDGTADSSQRGQSETAVTSHARYEVTAEGRDALAGILAEYDRIFEQREFEPLLINPELDPHEHLRQYDPGPAEPDPDVSFDEMREDEGILGEIADSFAPLDDELGPSPGPANGEPDDSNPGPEPSAGAQPTTPTEPVDEPETGTAQSPELETERSRGHRNGPATDPSDAVHPSESTEGGEQVLDEQVPEETFVGEYTRDEVLDAVVAATGVIDEGGLVRTSVVKSAAWEAVDRDGRSQTDLWEAVRDVLITMDATHGREGGHVWMSNEFTVE